MGDKTEIDAAISAIQTADLRQLRSETWLETQLLPRLGLSEVAPHCYPENLRQYCGKGIRSFQQPNQFARYLCYLSTLKLESYIEIGVWQGGTFIITVEYISRFNNLKRAFGMDVSIQQQMRDYASRNPIVDLFEIDSKNPAAADIVGKHWWDLALIDGDHSFEGCLNDYKLVRNHAGLVAMHDIESDHCPEVGQVWRQLLDVVPAYLVHEFTEQYVEIITQTTHRNMGLGVLALAAQPNATSAALR